MPSSQWVETGAVEMLGCTQTQAASGSAGMVEFSGGGVCVLWTENRRKGDRALLREVVESMEEATFEGHEVLAEVLELVVCVSQLECPNLRVSSDQHVGTKQSMAWCW